MFVKDLRAETRKNEIRAKLIKRLHLPLSLEQFLILQKRSLLPLIPL